MNFDRDWRFHLGDVTGAQDPTFADSGWRRLDLPHDWSIEGKFSEQNPAGVAGGAPPGGGGGDRETVSGSPARSGNGAYLEFDGGYRNNGGWVNGEYLGNRPHGRTSFCA